jgi:hypothetical protein
MAKRLDATGDLWANLFAKRQALPTV